MSDYSEMIQEAIKLGLLEAQRILQPKNDELSQREAYAEFGRAFVNEAERQGKISVIRKGHASNSKKLYSRVDLAKLVAERNMLRSIIRLETAKNV